MEGILTAELIIGAKHVDKRGTLIFFNELSLEPVKRFYVVEPDNKDTVRAWQGHKKEQKWFYVLSGSFKVVLLKPDNWEIPGENLDLQEFNLSKDINQILHIPGGFVNGFQALELNSRLMVFSDSTLSKSIADDFRFDKSLWYEWRN